MITKLQGGDEGNLHVKDFVKDNDSISLFP